MKLKTELKEQKSQSSQYTTELEKELADRNTQLDLQTKNIENFQQLINQTKLKLEQLEESQKNSQAAFQNKEIEIARLKEEFERQKYQLNANIVKLEKELADKHSQLDLQTKNIENFQQLINQTKLKLEQLEESQKNSQAALQNKEIEIARLKEEFERQKYQSDRYTTELEKELADKNSQLDLKTKNIQNLQQQIKQIQSKSDRFETAKNSTQPVQLESDREYERLILFLSARKWQKANRETSNLLLKIMNKEKDLRLDRQAIKNFPTAKLQEIDRLWHDYTQGRFSFSTQLEIWEDIGGLPDVYESTLYQEWAEIVGWRINGNWKNYSDLNFTIDAPVGQFPAISLSWSDWGAAWCGQETIELLSKIERNQSHKVHPEAIDINHLVDKGQEDIEKGIQDITKGFKEFGDSFKHRRW